jgi:hypothetical protein
MQVDFQEQTLARLRKISAEAGIREEYLVQKAVLFYLDAIQSQVDLKNEMNDWEMLSDEALSRFEEML